jgi:type IV secretory pathway VirD2 relaxase
MTDRDDLPIFKPIFGKRDRASKSSSPPRLRNLVLAYMRGASAGSRGKSPTRRSRIAVRPPGAGSRRAVIKVHVAPLRGGGAKAAALHLSYIQRDGVAKDGSPGVLYGADGPVTSERFGSPLKGEKHQFRLIVSPEDASELDLELYVRRFMSQVERDLGRRLEWAAVNHYDTDNPHAHVVIRGVDRDGQEVRMPKAYVSHGLRHRAQELATEELGPRPERDVARQRHREMTLDRFTDLDRALERRAVGDQIEFAPEPKTERARQAETLLVGRLQHLESLRLAEKVTSRSWTLLPGWKEHLRELGTRGDIIKEMHSALRGDPARYRIIKRDPSPEQHPEDLSRVAYGRVVKKGLADELRGTYFAVIETPSGDGYYVPLDHRAAEDLRQDDLVRMERRPERWGRREDVEIDRVAQGNRGVYDEELTRGWLKAQANLNTQMSPSTFSDIATYFDHGSRRTMTANEIVQSHAKRLIELEKLGLATRMADGKWSVSELLEKLQAKDQSHPRTRLVVKRQLGIREQVRHVGPVWLDGVRSDELALYGLGAELRKAVAERQAFVRNHGVDPAAPGAAAALRNLERRALARHIAEETGATYMDKAPAKFRGQVRIHAGRDHHGVAYAEINDGRRFVLVPATRELRVVTGQAVTITRDARGRIQARAAEPDRGEL